MTVDSPVDITQELPLNDENELPPERPPSGAATGWPIVASSWSSCSPPPAGSRYWLTSGSSTPTGLVITTVTVAVTTGTIQQTVASSGTIEPASQANLNSAVSGTVTAVDVKAGQTVTVGPGAGHRRARPRSPTTSTRRRRSSLRPTRVWPPTRPRAPARPRSTPTRPPSPPPSRRCPRRRRISTTPR